MLLFRIWFSSRTGQPHKYSVRRHHEQCHFGKTVSRSSVIDAAALVISDTQLPLDSWAKPSLKHFISSVGQSSTFNKNTISVEEIVAAMRKANRPLSEAHRAELIAAGKAILIYETDPSRGEVKPEPLDRAAAADGIEIEEIEGGLDDSMGEGNHSCQVHRRLTFHFRHAAVRNNEPSSETAASANFCSVFDRSGDVWRNS